MASSERSHSRTKTVSPGIATCAAVSLFAFLFTLQPGAAAPDSDILKQAQQVFSPLPSNAATSEFPITPERVELGRKLYFEPRISVDGTVSCARCHQPALYGTDGLALPHGAHDKANPRNAPTILNAAIQFAEHWRGDRKNVEDQAIQALIGPPSFGNEDYASAMAKLKAIPGYSAMFAKAFPDEQDPVNQQNWGKAIGAYERTLITPSRFDDYLKGSPGALTPVEQRGLRKFMEIGCSACHSGPGVGGDMYQKFGIMEEYWKETGSKSIDKGRFDVTHNPNDMYVFKVPSLRNVAMSPPYFHDGSVNSLPQAVRTMAQVQLGKTLDDEDVNELVAFLQSLTGKLPDEFVNAPILPASAFEAIAPNSTTK
jgi:cytochrome c peroxidase